jgi:hypothetical protein
MMNDARRRDFLRDWGVDLAIGAGCAVFVALLGPFGSYFNGPLWQRVMFQLGCFWPGILLYGSLIRIILGWELKPATSWAAIIGMALVVNAAFQLWVTYLALSIWPFLKILRPIDWYLQDLVTTLPVVVGFTLLIRARLRQRRLAGEAGDAPPTPFGLLGAAPAAVLCLQMEDHYVRVHTLAGSRLVLMTLSQAMAIVENADGLQVHRSWWIARKAVVRTVAHGRNLRLELVNGIVAPVSRSAVAVVRAAGWMSDDG